MICQQCIDKVEKADKLNQTESYKTKNEPLETGKKYKLCAKAYLITEKKKTGAICSQNGMT